MSLEYWDRVGLLLFLLASFRYPLDLHLFNLLIDSAALVVPEECFRRTKLFNLLQLPRTNTSSKLSALRTWNFITRKTSSLIKVFEEGFNLILCEELTFSCS